MTPTINASLKLDEKIDLVAVEVTNKECAEVALIRRELGRGYGLTLKQMRLMCELLQRFGI